MYFFHFFNCKFLFTIWTYLVSKWRQWNGLSNNKIYFQTASKMVQSFGWNFVHKKRAGQTHTQTNWSNNITPPRFRGGVKTKRNKTKQKTKNKQTKKKKKKKKTKKKKKKQEAFRERRHLHVSDLWPWVVTLKVK